jgi:phospholipid transport system transporter-binding protein
MQLPATLTIAQARAAWEQLAVQAREGDAAAGSMFSVDASALREFDTATLALLLQARRQAQAQGRSFEVVGAPHKLVQLARLYGVDALLELKAKG